MDDDNGGCFGVSLAIIFLICTFFYYTHHLHMSAWDVIFGVKPMVIINNR